jgi:hypothetical protein
MPKMPRRKALLNEMTKEAYKDRRCGFGTESSPTTQDIKLKI